MGQIELYKLINFVESSIFLLIVSDMHFVYKINKLTTTKVDSNLFRLLYQQSITNFVLSCNGLECMTPNNI